MIISKCEDEIKEKIINNLNQELSEYQIDAIGSLISKIGIEKFFGSSLFTEINLDPNNVELITKHWEFFDCNGSDFNRIREEVNYYFYGDANY